MPDDKIEWLSDQECREAEDELTSDQLTRDRFFEYYANSNEEYVRLQKEYERTGIISQKLIALENRMVLNDPPRHFIFEYGIP